jgi:hypothetical protein
MFEREDSEQGDCSCMQMFIANGANHMLDAALL